MLQIAEHCSSQAEASGNDVRDRGRVEQCLKDHVAQNKITASSNKECFAVISIVIMVTVVALGMGPGARTLWRCRISANLLSFIGEVMRSMKLRLPDPLQWLVLGAHFVILPSVFDLTGCKYLVQLC